MSFPTSPTNGQIYGNKKYNSTKNVWEFNYFNTSNDGTGTNLDADTVDGIESKYISISGENFDTASIKGSWYLTKNSSVTTGWLKVMSIDTTGLSYVDNSYEITLLGRYVSKRLYFHLFTGISAAGPNIYSFSESIIGCKGTDLSYFPVIITQDTNIFTLWFYCYTSWDVIKTRVDSVLNNIYTPITKYSDILQVDTPTAITKTVSPTLLGVVGHTNYGSYNVGSQAQLYLTKATQADMATQLLADLKTVDGAGSGLDADLIDNINSNQIIYGDNLRGTTIVTNINNIVKSGFYHSSDTTNNPTTSQYSIIHIQAESEDNYATQIASQIQLPLSFIRSKNGGVWGSWQKIWNSNNDGTGSGLDTDLVRGITPGNKGLISLATTTNNVFDLKIQYSGTETGWKKVASITGLGSVYNRGMMQLSYLQHNASTYQDGVLSFSFSGSDTTPTIAYFNETRFNYSIIETSRFKMVRVGAGAYDLYFYGIINDIIYFNILSSMIGGTFTYSTDTTLYTTDLGGTVAIVTNSPTNILNKLITVTPSTYIPTQGIKFPATQVASSDANTLDDYKEGTFTPTITIGGSSTGITYSAQSAKYIKIGSKVTFNLYILLSSKNSLTGTVLVTGLPYTCGSTESDRGCCTFIAKSITYSGFVEAVVNASTTSIALVSLSESGVETVLNGSNLSDTSILRISGTYFTN